MKNIIPYNDTYYLGKGLNSLKGEAKGSIFSNFEFSEIAAAQGQEVDFKLEQIESTEQLYNSLGISVEASGSYGLFSASGKFQMAQESNFNSHSIFFVLKVRVKNAVKRITNYQIRPEVIKMLEDGQSERFQRSFGDSYIEGIITGGEFFALFELVCSDESSKQKISAELEMSYGGLGAGFDLKASFQNTVNSASSKKNLKVVTYQSGGKGLDLVTNPEEIFTRAKTFPSLVQDMAGVPYEVIKASFETLALPEGPNFVEIEHKKHVLETYCRDIIDLRKKLNDLKYILLNPEEFELNNEVEELTALGEQAKALGNLINEYTQHAKVCADSTTQCSEFVPSFTPSLLQLPKRKNALDVVVIYDGINYSGDSHYITKGEYTTAQAIGGLQDNTIESIKVPQNFKVVLWEEPNYAGRNWPIIESTPDLSVNNFQNKVSSIYITDTNDPKLKPEKVSEPTPPPTGDRKPIVSRHFQELASARNHLRIGRIIGR